MQGHSWGGYQIAYMITKTNLFAAAEAGAPVSNMTSAYGGIRWSSGMSRMFQYERTQRRIGGTLWESISEYLHNSPVFFADKIHTPLLMLHNDEDGAVPWLPGHRDVRGHAPAPEAGLDAQLQRTGTRTEPRGGPQGLGDPHAAVLLITL